MAASRADLVRELVEVLGSPGLACGAQARTLAVEAHLWQVKGARYRAEVLRLRPEDFPAYPDLPDEEMPRPGAR